jgi:hypothetical protein
MIDLLPDHEDVWLSAMERYIAALTECEGSEAQ